jgi:hypothetical protein
MLPTLALVWATASFGNIVPEGKIRLQNSNQIDRYGPVVDGSFVKNLPSEEFKAGNFYKVPLIVDRDAYEGVIFSNETDLGTNQNYETTDVSFLTSWITA